MDANPYEAPKSIDLARPIPGVRRRWWRRICLWSVAVLLLVSQGIPILDRAFIDHTQKLWVGLGFVILNLISLGSMLMALIAGIGWLLSPRAPKE